MPNKSRNDADLEAAATREREIFESAFVDTDEDLEPWIRMILRVGPAHAERQFTAAMAKIASSAESGRPPGTLKAATGADKALVERWKASGLSAWKFCEDSTLLKQLKAAIKRVERKLTD
jgi:hypothetical protein